MFVFSYSIHSWDHPPPAWARLCPVGVVSARLQRSSCLSTCRSWRLSDSVRRGTWSTSIAEILLLLFVCCWGFLFVLPDACFYSTRISLFALLDESSELQTQICNSFKSLAVQLQGELAAEFHSKLFIRCAPLHVPSFFPQKFWINAKEIYWKWKTAN